MKFEAMINHILDERGLRRDSSSKHTPCHTRQRKDDDLEAEKNDEHQPQHLV